MPKVSDAHKAQVRQRLLDAARAVVLRDGHEGATTRAILDEAGMSAGALYSYFASKEELFEALVEQVVEADVVRYQREGGGPDELIGFARTLLTEPDLPALAWFRGRMSNDDEVRQTQQRLNRYLVDTFAPLVKTAQADGALRPDVDAEALSELVDLLSDALNRRQATGSFATSFQRVGSLAADLLIAAIAEPDAGAGTKSVRTEPTQGDPT